MRFATFPLILLTCASACAPLPPPGRAEAILDAAETPARAHAAALTAPDVPPEAAATGLALLTLLSCWWEDCPPPPAQP